MKPHKGTIRGIRKDYPEYKNLYPPNLGYIIAGYWKGHPDFGFSRGYTSLVVKKGRWSKPANSERQCEIETLNSRYTWVDGS